MTKIIEVDNCAGCPYRDGTTFVHSICALKLDEIKNIHTIPEWCPLEDDE
jgi:hypothetical protein